MTRTARVPLVLALLLVAASGCNPSSASPGHDDPEPFDAPGGCVRACAVATSCFDTVPSAPECVQGCEAAVAGHGELGADAIDACADCLEGADCAALAEGVCDWACGDVAGFDPDAPPHAGPGCAETWSEDGHEWTVRCKWDDYDAAYDCECAADGVLDYGFSSLDFCSLDAPHQMDQANEGCYWAVGLHPDCYQNWNMGDDAYGVSCVGTAVGWDCSCWSSIDDVGVGFGSTDFCELDLAARTAFANAQCGYTLDGSGPCETTWSLDLHDYTVRCNAGQCSCDIDGASGASFASSTFCMMEYAARVEQANAGCGWALPW